MIKKHALYAVGTVLVCCLLIACGKTAPQRPSQRSGEVPAEDTATLALLELNQRLVREADREVRVYVEHEPEAYALLEYANAWCCIFDHGDTDGAAPQNNESWTLHIRTHDLEGRLLLDEHRAYFFSRGELPVAVDVLQPELRHGERLRIVAPWYSAYGMHGNGIVAPYTSVVLDVTVE